MSQSIRHNQPLWCCDHSANGRLVATAGTGKCIFIYDTGPLHGNMELRLRIQGIVMQTSNVFIHIFIIDILDLK